MSNPTRADVQSPNAGHLLGSTIAKLSQLGSEIRNMHLRGQQYLAAHPDVDLIDLSLGNPDLEPPTEVIEGLRRLVHEPAKGAHRYMDNAGFPEVRRFLADRLTPEVGVSLTAEQVFMTCGAAGAIHIALRAVLDPGDEVVVFAPFFSEYVPYTVALGGVPVVVPGTPQHLPDVAGLEARLGPKTRVVMLNHPNNPSGVAYPESLLDKIALVLERHRQSTGRIVHVVSDEPYANLLFGGRKLPSILSRYPHAWVVRSHSKDLGLAGERIGYLVHGPAMAGPETLGALRNAARALGFVNAPAMMQRVLPLAYGARVPINRYEERVSAFVSVLREAGFGVVQPDGGFFVFPRAPIADDRAFCEKLLTHGVLCVPGSGFGSPGHFRVSLTQPLDRILMAAQRIVAAARPYRSPNAT